jgi:hypothetical protein
MFNRMLRTRDGAARRATAFGVSLAAGVALLLMGSVSASAAEPTVIRPLTASECGTAPGPGTWNSSCITVNGTGQWVNTISGELDSTTAPYFPQDVCDVTVHVFGILQFGAHYSRQATNTGCGVGDIGVKFVPETYFQNGSLLCEQTEWSGQWSRAECVKIVG